LKIKQHIKEDVENGTVAELQKYHGICLDGKNLKNTGLALRNAVNPMHGLHIFNCAFKEKQKTLSGGQDEKRN
jgi:hypothetical protein